VTDASKIILRTKTNTAFDGGNVQAIAHEQPFVLNTGGSGGADRSLAIYRPENSSPGTAIQFQSDVSGENANAVQLAFDLEVWGHVGDPAALTNPSLGVSLELDFGNGFTPAIDWGHVTTKLDPLAVAGGDVNGNSVGNHVSFLSDVTIAHIMDAQTMRIRWNSDDVLGSQAWVLGLDNVSLTFLLLGDFNDDRLVTSLDIDLLSEAVRTGDTSPVFDLNGDRSVDALDRSVWVEQLVETHFGDANLDGAVDFSDFLTLAQNYSLSAGWKEGDFNGNGVVEFADFLLLGNAYQGSARVAAASIPEPSSRLLLIAMAVAGCYYGRPSQRSRESNLMG
jgi:hypothetical protein